MQVFYFRSPAVVVAAVRPLFVWGLFVSSVIRLPFVCRLSAVRLSFVCRSSAVRLPFVAVVCLLFVCSLVCLFRIVAFVTLNSSLVLLHALISSLFSETTLGAGAITERAKASQRVWCVHASFFCVCSTCVAYVCLGRCVCVYVCVCSVPVHVLTSSSSSFSLQSKCTSFWLHLQVWI